MTINITGDNVELDQDLKDYAAEKILKFAEIVLEPAICDIVLVDDLGTKDGNDKIARFNLTLPNEKNAIHVEARTDDFRASIDLAEEKLGKEIERYKEKVKIGPRFEEE